MTFILKTFLNSLSILKLIVFNMSTEFHTIDHSLLFDRHSSLGLQGYHFHWLFLLSLFPRTLSLSSVLDVAGLHGLLEEVPRSFFLN